MEFTHYPSEPRFDVEGEGRKAKVWLLCSYCRKRIRQLRRWESIRIDRGWYCEECDPGVVVENPSQDMGRSEG